MVFFSLQNWEKEYFSLTRKGRFLLMKRSTFAVSQKFASGVHPLSSPHPHIVSFVILTVDCCFKTYIQLAV